MSVLAAIVGKEFRAMSRDIHGLMVLFVMPAIFILIMSLALKDAFTPSTLQNISFTIVDFEQKKLTKDLSDQLKQSGYHYQDSSDISLKTIEQQLRLGKLDFALVINEGFEKAQVDYKTVPTSPPLRLLINPSINPIIDQGFQGQLFEVLSRQKIKIIMRLNGLSLGPPDGGGLAEKERSYTASMVAVEYPATVNKTRPTSVQLSVPAWLVFSMFFVVIPISTILIKEREAGTLSRLSTMQVSGFSILLGKLIPFFLVNQVQAVAMILVGIYLVPLLGGDALQLGPSLLGLWLMTCATSIAAIGYALLIAVLVRTTEQATTIGGVSNIILAALGGIMVPKFTMPDFMQHITEFSPMAWALEGYLDVLVRAGGVGDILYELGTLLLFACVMLMLAVVAYRIKGFNG